MTYEELVATPTKEQLSACKQRQADSFRGNLEQLTLLYRVLRTPNRSDARRNALALWSRYNTSRSDSTNDGAGGPSHKVSYREDYRRVNLRGLTSEADWIPTIGPIDFRGADLRNASFDSISLAKAKFDFADLRGARFTHCCFRSASFQNALLQGATFTECLMAFVNLRDAVAKTTKGMRTSFAGSDLQGANLSGADFRGAVFTGANLQVAQLIETDFRGADLSGCQVFGAAAWSPRIDNNTVQQNLLVTPADPIIAIGDRGQWMNIAQPTAPVSPMRTDSLEHAHLIHLMSNPDLSVLLESVTNKGVLLLGRFSGEHGEILDALRVALRDEGYLPLKFDFRKPGDRTLKETVLTLAGLCRFIVADITEASSIPLELTTIVKDYKIPVVPIQRRGRKTFSMFESIEQEYRDRVLPPLEYRNVKDLIRALHVGVIDRALQRSGQLIQAKGFATSTVTTAELLGERK